MDARSFVVSLRNMGVNAMNNNVTSLLGGYNIIHDQGRL